MLSESYQFFLKIFEVSFIYFRYLLIQERICDNQSRSRINSKRSHITNRMVCTICFSNYFPFLWAFWLLLSNSRAQWYRGHKRLQQQDLYEWLIFLQRHFFCIENVWCLHYASLKHIFQEQKHTIMKDYNHHVYLTHKPWYCGDFSQQLF